MNTLQENIIQPAWNFVKEDAKIKKAYFFPAFLGVIFITLILVYQTIYTYVVIFEKKEEVLEYILNFVHSTYFFEFVLLVLAIVFIYVFIIPIFEGALISYISKKKEHHSTSFSDALWVWLFHFLPLIEFGSIFSQFKLITIFNAYLFLLRFLWIDYISILSWSFVAIILFPFIINILFIYTRYVIITENAVVLPAIGMSSKLAILNPKTTVKLYFMMFILNLKVCINFLVFLFFPILVSSAILYITSQIFLYIMIALLVLFFLIFVIFLSYMASVLEIFKTSIWYFAFLEAKKKLALQSWWGHHDDHHEDNHH